MLPITLVAGVTAAAPTEGVEIPLAMVAGRPQVDVLIDGKGPYPFVLDTGASLNLIDAGVARELGLEVIGQREIGAPGFVAVVAAGGTLAVADEGQQIVEVLGLAPGMSVADVGAGDGEWTVVLADAVGPEGRVYATEVDDDLVAELRRLSLDPARADITALRGTDTATGLDPGCCDALLLRLVYHDFTDPVAMRRSLLTALRPGGRIAAIDVAPQTGWRHLEGVPDRGGHGIRMDDLIAEMTSSGFAVEAIHGDWIAGEADRYCVVFTAPAPE
jgi:predicted methyltransferase